MSHGVRIFRVDNPHTKPVHFWEQLLAEVRSTDPDVLFLAEAFTRPAMMRQLAAVGFHQSYTYFTWRTAKWELEEYFTQLAHETAHVFRPNCFVNTPDILHASLQYGGPPVFQHPGHPGRDPLPHAGASTPASSCSSTWRCALAARSTSTRRSTTTARGTGPRPRPRAGRWRPTSPA